MSCTSPIRYAFLVVAPALLFAACRTTEPRISEKAPPLVQAAQELKYGRKITLPAEDRAGLYLDAAALASAEFADAAAEPKARTLYNTAAAELTDLLRHHDDGQLWNHPLTLAANGKTYRLTFQPGTEKGAWKPDYFTDFKPAADIKRKHLRRDVTEPGVGGTLVGFRKTPGRAPFEPRAGFVAPVTATLDFQGNNAALTLNDPAKRRTTRIRGATEPLAADFTAPIAARPVRSELWSGLMGLIEGEKYLGPTGLFMLHPYDPDRIPVLLVHGLASTPQMWGNVINEVEADPQLRGRFQFWIFRYPTGVPVSYSALRCREELARVAKRNGLPRGVIIVGHSMGGLLARMQAVESDRVIWDRTFGGKADRLYAKLPADHLVKRALIFHSNPEVKRLVFICTPHRGSEMALGSIGALAIRLITIPASLATTLQESLGDVLQTVGGKRQIPTSINSLSPKSTTLLAMNTLPIRAPYHSIIGDCGKGNSPLSSDGVVPYRSSHLDGAQSELIVPGPHGAYEVKETIAELVRILHQHVEKTAPSKRPRSPKTKP